MGNFYRFAVRLVRTLKYLKDIWQYGGYSQAYVSQINYGEILKGKRVLVTGGGSGIGLAITKKCLSEGASVVITGRNVERLKAAFDDLNSSRLHILEWDVGDVSLINEKLEEAFSMLGGYVNILVNNAEFIRVEDFFLSLKKSGTKSMGLILRQYTF